MPEKVKDTEFTYTIPQSIVDNFRVYLGQALSEYNYTVTKRNFDELLVRCLSGIIENEIKIPESYKENQRRIEFFEEKMIKRTGEQLKNIDDELVIRNPDTPIFLPGSTHSITIQNIRQSRMKQDFRTIDYSLSFRKLVYGFITGGSLDYIKKYDASVMGKSRKDRRKDDIMYGKRLAKIIHSTCTFPTEVIAQEHKCIYDMKAENIIENLGITDNESLKEYSFSIAEIHELLRKKKVTYCKYINQRGGYFCEGLFFMKWVDGSTRLLRIPYDSAVSEGLPAHGFKYTFLDWKDEIPKGTKLFLPSSEDYKKPGGFLTEFQNSL